MDRIQKALIEAGHKDLAQRYYLNFMSKKAASTKELKTTIIKMLQNAVRKINTTNRPEKILDFSKGVTNELEELIAENRYFGQIVP